MIIMGIDPGLATVGYGIIRKTVFDRRLTLEDYGVISTPKTEALPGRLAMLYDGMNILIEKFKPDAIAVEELFFNTNTSTAINVAQARGVILLSAVKSVGHLFEYTPLQIKLALTGTGRADKKQVQYMVKMLLGLKAAPKPDDAADALAAAITHANNNQAMKSNRIEEAVHRA
jgi:crossover junction endodeoxyribonuclease RuvC